MNVPSASCHGGKRAIDTTTFGALGPSELKAGFNQPPELAKGLVSGGPLAQGTAQNNQGRGHGDVIRDLDFVPPFPDKVAIVWRG